MHTMEEVLAKCSTPAFIPAFKTLKVPSFAAGVSDSLSFETFKGNGEATCMIYLQPSAASFQPSSFNKSNSTNDNFSVETLFSSNVFFVCSVRLFPDLSWEMSWMRLGTKQIQDDRDNDRHMTEHWT